MLKSEGQKGMKVYFGRGKGEKTLGEIIKINRKNFKVKTLESRGTHRNYKVGTVWTVPPSLCEVAGDDAVGTTKPDPNQRSTRKRRTRSRRNTRARTGYERQTSFGSLEERANQQAKTSANKLKDGCDLSNPPTYIKSSRRYLDGTKIRKNGTEYDGRRQKLYDAERPVRVGRKFATVDQCQNFIDKVLDSAWFKRRFDLQSITVEKTQGWTKSYCNQRRRLIRLLDVHMNERVLLHELVHAIVPKPHAWHGRLFCAIYLDMVRHYIGEEAYDELLEGYRRENVKYQPRNKVRR